MTKNLEILALVAGLSLFVFQACGPKPGGDEQTAAPDPAAAGTVTLTPEAALTAKIETVRARVREFRPAVKASGTVAFNGKRFVRVTPRVAGRVEKVLAFEGERVRAGQALFELYSPDLLAAQADYLQILARAPSGGRAAVTEDEKLYATLLESAGNRLRLMGFEAADLAELDAGRRALPVLGVRSPLSGTVVESGCTAGSAVEAGAPLCAVADLGSLWVRVHVFEKDLGAVSPGAGAEITVAAYPGRVFPGMLSLVGSVMDEATRTVVARVEAANPEGKLKPGMFAEVAITPGRPESALAVPEQAVRTMAGKTVVFVPRGGGTYALREVKTGRAFDGYVEILAGLADGDAVVTGGSFDVKAEMLKGSLEGEG